MIDRCLKLHGHLCPPEFLPFHETLEKFFRKNFRDEIRRLVVEDVSATSPSVGAGHYEQSLQNSNSTISTRRPFTIPPLQLGRSILTSPVQSPSSPIEEAPTVKQTPLQRHLAHLTKHGINGVSSAPGESVGGSDSLSGESPHNSFVNVGNGGVHSPQASSTSIAPSHMGSMGSLSSLRGRFSRFGSLNFGRRAQSTSTS